jgi:hypothetical protein
MVMITRNFYISLATAALVLFSGGLLFRGSEAGTQVVVVLTFAAYFTVAEVLDGRDRRRRQSDQHRAPTARS